MNGTKEAIDGNVRKDFPGGFPGDERNAFTAKGRTKAENAMYRWIRRLLHWRQGNDVITKGTQTQFIPYNGIYVIARQYDGKTVLTIINGTSKRRKMPLCRYAEVIGDHHQAINVMTHATVTLGDSLSLAPRKTLILEY